MAKVWTAADERILAGDIERLKSLEGSRLMPVILASGPAARRIDAGRPDAPGPMARAGAMLAGAVAAAILLLAVARIGYDVALLLARL